MHIRLLIVDELEAHRIILTEMLKKHKYIKGIETAKNVYEMLEKLKDSSLNAIIFDLNTERINRPNQNVDELFSKHQIDLPLILLMATTPHVLPQLPEIVDIIPKVELYSPGRLDQALDKLHNLICR